MLDDKTSGGNATDAPEKEEPIDTSPFFTTVTTLPEAIRAVRKIRQLREKTS